jgi:drug/metabolite transporter (DMT)-like permease
MNDLLARFLRFRRGPWENLAIILIALGVLMLLQPISLALYTYSFVVTLLGTVMFIVVSKFPD